MDALQCDIDALEQEKTELKDNLRLISKKTLLENITKQAAGLSGEIRLPWLRFPNKGVLCALGAGMT